MPWNPRQPRDPAGRWRKTNLEVGWHEYSTRAGEIKHYYINNLNQLESGSNILHMSAQGAVNSSFATADPLERIHILGNEYGKQMSVAASDETTFGVINHSKPAPADMFSLNRGSEFQPVSENLPENETAFGGRAANLSARKDGKVYDTLNAQKAEQANNAAFADPNNKVFSADPGDFAEGAVEARHYYEREFGLSESAARDMPVYVYADRNGNISVEPVYRPESVPMSELGMNPDDPAPEGFHKNGDNLVAFVRRRSPNTHGGTGSVKLRGRDLTRMTRSMQKEGLESVDFTVSGGTSTSPKTGKPLQNALHFRSDYTNENSGDDITMWGSIESMQHGVQPEKAHRAFASQQEYDDYRRKTQVVRERAAARYLNPKTPEDAAKLLRTRYGANKYFSSDIQMRDGKDGVAFAVTSPGGHTRMLSDANGNYLGKEAADAEGFAAMYNNGKASANRVTADNVKLLSDGNFRVRKNGDEKFYTSAGTPSKGVRMRGGKPFGYNEAGEFVELYERP